MHVQALSLWKIIEHKLIKGTNAEDLKIYQISLSSHKNNMPEVSHFNSIYSLEIYEMFVYKHTETIEYVIKQATFKKTTSFTGK